MQQRLALHSSLTSLDKPTASWEKNSPLSKTLSRKFPTRKILTLVRLTNPSAPVKVLQIKPIECGIL